MDSYNEKRIAPRRSTMIPAIIIYNAGQSRMECVIRNLSDTGAKIEVSSVKSIPQAFDLMVPRHRPQSCRVAWRAMRELGVEFLN